MSTISTATEREHSAGGSIVGTVATAPKRLWVAYITWRIERAAMAHLQLDERSTAQGSWAVALGNRRRRGR